MRRLFPKWSGRRDSNSRHLPWQGSALPTELHPQTERQEVGRELARSTAIFPTSRPPFYAGQPLPPAFLADLAQPRNPAPNRSLSAASSLARQPNQGSNWAHASGRNTHRWLMIRGRRPTPVPRRPRTETRGRPRPLRVGSPRRGARRTQLAARNDDAAPRPASLG